MQRKSSKGKKAVAKSRYLCIFTSAKRVLPCEVLFFWLQKHNFALVPNETRWRRARALEVFCSRRYRDAEQGQSDCNMPVYRSQLTRIFHSSPFEMRRRISDSPDKTKWRQNSCIFSRLLFPQKFPFPSARKINVPRERRVLLWAEWSRNKFGHV